MSASSCYIASCQICPYPFLALCLCVLSFSAAQRNQLCVCLRYLVNLLRENRLPAAAPSHHSHLLCLTIVIAERSARLLDIRTHGLRREVVFSRGSFVRVGVLEGRFRPISLSRALPCVCWLYLRPSPGLPAPGEQAASRGTVTLHQPCQSHRDRRSPPLRQARSSTWKDPAMLLDLK